MGEKAGHLLFDDIHLDRVLNDALASCNLLLLDLHGHEVKLKSEQRAHSELVSQSLIPTMTALHAAMAMAFTLVFLHHEGLQALG